MLNHHFYPFCLAVLFSLLNSSFSSAGSPDSSIPVIQAALSKKFPGARIEMTSPIQWLSHSGSSGEGIESVVILSENLNGAARFRSTSKKNPFFAEGLVGFSAWVPAHIATRRIYPGELLSGDSFMSREVDIATGAARDYRGVLYPANRSIQGLESIQSILEGQFLLTSAVQRIPDIRRGDSVRIRMTSGPLVLSTLGIAEEPGYFNHSIRVIAGKTKKELSGELQTGRIVEVKL